LSLCEYFHAIEIAVVHIVLGKIRLVGSEARQCIRCAAVHARSAGYARRALVRRGIADLVPVHGTIIIRTAAFKGVIEAKIMAHLVGDHDVVGVRRAEIARFQDNAVQVRTMGRGKISVSDNGSGILFTTQILI